MDQGSQFISEAFTDILHSRGITISMDGKGWWMDNAFIEWLWKSVKYEDIYVKAYGSMTLAKKGLAFDFALIETTHSLPPLKSGTPLCALPPF